MVSCSLRITGKYLEGIEGRQPYDKLMRVSAIDRVDSIGYRSRVNRTLCKSGPTVGSYIIAASIIFILLHPGVLLAVHTVDSLERFCLPRDRESQPLRQGFACDFKFNHDIVQIEHHHDRRQTSRATDNPQSRTYRRGHGCRLR